MATEQSIAVVRRVLELIEGEVLPKTGPMPYSVNDMVLGLGALIGTALKGLPTDDQLALVHLAMLEAIAAAGIDVEQAKLILSQG